MTITPRFVQTATATIAIKGKSQSVVMQGGESPQISWNAASNGPISAIVIFHDGGENREATLEAVPVIVETARLMGYEPVAL